MSKRPDIGSTMFMVHEHLYYIKNHAIPIKEYCVCSGAVTGFYTGGYTEVRLVGKSPKGFPTPYSYRLSEIGTRLFYTAREAAEYAQQLTEDYERRWGWVGAPEIPMRRPWAKYLI
jgi:hypothetical protein